VIDALQGMELLCSGSLFTRTKICGKPYCRCAQDPQNRHGPYFVWIHREGRRLIQRVISPPQAQAVRRAIADFRHIRRLLARCDRESAKEILRLDDVNS
jgi:hypothetical protein